MEVGYGVVVEFSSFLEFLSIKKFGHQDLSKLAYSFYQRLDVDDKSELKQSIKDDIGTICRDNPLLIFILMLPMHIEELKIIGLIKSPGYVFVGQVMPLDEVKDNIPFTIDDRKRIQFILSKYNIKIEANFYITNNVETI
jgi:hypothetical protein